MALLLQRVSFHDIDMFVYFYFYEYFITWQHFCLFIFAAQSFLNYVLLCLIFTTTLACRPGENGLLSVLKKRGWKYFFVAVADVEANYLVVQAYQYTTLTSVQLLDCFTIPVVLLLSWAVLKVRYQIIHIVGVSVCLMGIGCLVWADADENNEPAKNRLLGTVYKWISSFYCVTRDKSNRLFIYLFPQVT